MRCDQCGRTDTDHLVRVAAINRVSGNRAWVGKACPACLADLRHDYAIVELTSPTPRLWADDCDETCMSAVEKVMSGSCSQRDCPVFSR